MEQFYSLTNEEKKIINETLPKNYIPAIMIRSNFHKTGFPQSLKGVLSSLGYDYQKYGYIKTHCENMSEMYDTSTFPKYFMVVYLSPEAYQLFLEHRWHVFKFKRIHKWEDNQIEVLYKNEIGEYWDAMTFPVGVVDIQKAKEVRDYIKLKHPRIMPKSVYKGNKALISYAFPDYRDVIHDNKPRLQATICKDVEEKYDAKFCNWNGIEIKEIIIPEKITKGSNISNDDVEK